MIRCSPTSIVFSLVVTALLTPSMHAAGDPKKDAPKPEESAFIAAMKAELKALELGLSKDIGEKIDGIKKSVGSLQTEIITLKAQQLDLKTQLDNQKVLIDQLMEERKKLIANSSPSEKRIANYGPTVAPSGRIMLVNLFSENVLFTVNGVDHVVPPGRSKSLDGVAAGMVRYEVFSMRHGFLDREAINLVAGETFTLTVYPKR